MANYEESKDPLFARRPAEILEGRNLDIVRVPQGRMVTGIMLSHDSIGCYTHWWGGRTVPCYQQNCKACADGGEKRWCSWLAVRNRGGGAILMLELPSAASAETYRFFREVRTFRGWGYQMQRVGKRANARLRIKWDDHRHDPATLPKAPCLAPILRNMWRVPDGALLSTPDDRINIYRPGDEPDYEAAG